MYHIWKWITTKGWYSIKHWSTNLTILFCTVVWIQLFWSHTNNVHTVIWFKVFLSNTNIFQIDLLRVPEQEPHHQLQFMDLPNPSRTECDTKSICKAKKSWFELKIVLLQECLPQQEPILLYRGRRAEATALPIVGWRRDRLLPLRRSPCPGFQPMEMISFLTTPTVTRDEPWIFYFMSKLIRY